MQVTPDWRDRQVQTTAAQDWYPVTMLDNMSRTLQSDQYAQATGTLIRRGQTRWDDRSRAYQNLRYAVDPDTGAVGNYLIGNQWYDGVGNVIMILPAGSNAFTKSAIDGAGRTTVQYLGYYASGSSSSSSTSGGAAGSPLPPGEGQGELLNLKGSWQAGLAGDLKNCCASFA